MTDDKAYGRAIGKRVRVWRVLHDETQDDLARKAGVTHNSVSAMECAQGLDAARLRRVAAAMGTPVADLPADPNEDGIPVPDGHAAWGVAVAQTRSKLSR